MKKGFYTVGSLVILLICAFVFVLLPVLTGRGGRKNELPPFGKYNGKEIRYEQGTDFANAVSNYGQYFQSMGYQIDNSTYYQIFNMAFNNTISKMVYQDAVKKSGWKASRASINREMRPYFTDETGKYSSKVYRSASTSRIEQVQSDVEDRLITERYYNDIFGSETEFVGSDALYGLKESDNELDFLLDMGKTKRGFSMVAFEKSSFPDSEKAAYLKANKDKFVKYDMSVITVEAESTAKSIAKRLKNEEITFADAVAEYSEKNYSNTEGKLSSTFGYQLERIINDSADFDTIKALGTGETSGIIATTTGYSIFHVDGNATEPDVEDENILRSVYSYLFSYESGVLEDYFIAKANDFKAVALRKGFDAACEEMEVEEITVEPFPLNYGNISIADGIDSSVSALSGAATNENFLSTVFGLKLNEYTEPMVLGNSVVVLQYTTEVESEGSDLSNLDQLNMDSAQKALLSNPKVENKVTEVYFNNFLN